MVQWICRMGGRFVTLRDGPCCSRREAIQTSAAAGETLTTCPLSLSLLNEFCIIGYPFAKLLLRKSKGPDAFHQYKKKLSTSLANYWGLCSRRRKFAAWRPVSCTFAMPSTTLPCGVQIRLSLWKCWEGEAKDGQEWYLENRWHMMTLILYDYDYLYYGHNTTHAHTHTSMYIHIIYIYIYICIITVPI